LLEIDCAIGIYQTIDDDEARTSLPIAQTWRAKVRARLAAMPQ
jgi:hypothetical protein